MKNYFVVSIIVIALLFIGGCGNSDKKNTSTSPYIGGSEGLSINFVNGAPPDTIYDKGGFPFDIAVSIKNKGEYTVKKSDIKVSIKGIYYSDFGLNSINDLIKSPEEDIISVRKDSDGRVIDGMETRVEFTNLNYKGSITGSMTPVNFIADACYKYETKSNVNLCIREKLTTTKDGVCKVNGNKQVFNSGAPIKISNFVESAMSENKLSFTFDIVHSGTGKFFKENSWCEEEYGKENIVHIKISSGIGKLSCTGLTGSASEGDVRVQNGKATVRCTLDVPKGERGDFEKGITITTDYKYRNTASKQITLKHAGE